MMKGRGRGRGKGREGRKGIKKWNGKERKGDNEMGREENKEMEWEGKGIMKWEGKGRERMGWDIGKNFFPSIDVHTIQ